MKTLLVSAVILLLATGCASINPQITKFDKENYKANKQFAKDQMETWSLSSGFILGMGLTNPIAFPIKSGDELRAVINSTPIILAIADLDRICKKLGYWNELDYDLGYALGAKTRLGSQAAIQMVRDFFPELMKYAPAVFGL
jgi:uncharacterized protein YceK